MLAVGDVERAVFARSATKPLQALPLLEHGSVAALGLDAHEVAVMCASHDGADVHLAAVRSLLQKGGVDEQQLGCGPHAPLGSDARRSLRERGEKPLRVHNNCSGKHAGFLALARQLGDDLASYLDPECASQREVAAAVAEMTGVEGRLPVGLDGCGAPTFVLPLVALARGFARLANPNGLSPVRAAACRTILDAVGRAPAWLAGEQRLCTALVRALPGRAFAKNGAEGVYAFAVAPDARRRRCPGALGVAIKVDDGQERGYQPPLLDLLLWLEVLEPDLGPALQRFRELELRNTQGRTVGSVKSVVEWPRHALRSAEAQPS